MNPRHSIRQRSFVALTVLGWLVCAGQAGLAVQRGCPIRLSGGLQITSISQPIRTLGAASSTSVLLSTSQYIQPPLAGFSPLVAITTSDERSYDFLDWDHDLQSGYTGSPLNAPADENFVVGLLDSGSVIDLVTEPSALTLGITGQYMTDSEFPIGGVGGTVTALLSEPIGIFAAGLGAIDGNGTLDLSQVVGHTNVSTVVSPEISCNTGETITAVIGTPLIAFHTAVIRNDDIQKVNVLGQTYTSPDVQILDPFDPCIPQYSRSIYMEFGGPTLATTANYYPDLEFLETPIFPTLLSLEASSIPLGGAFFSQIGLLEGEPGPTNIIQYSRMMVDTGAQSSIISTGVAANLSLPFEPDFTVNVCGVGGYLEDVPGYYIDYVKINALGGALEFSNAPFVVLDLESPEGGALDGVLGMNFFWNRNIVFEPSLSLSGFVHLSEPVAFAYADFDNSGRVDMTDYAILAAAWSAGPDDANWNPACDLFVDELIDERDLAALCDRWLAVY